MQLRTSAAFALTLSSSVAGQGIPDLSTAAPIVGEWNYSASTSGSDARFADSSGIAQLVIHCTPANRHVTISKPSAGPAPYLTLWTSSQSRTIAASFDSATSRLTVEVEAQEPLLDALSTSRGRIGIAAGTQPSLVVPAWPEIARVVEDCRS